MLQPLHDRNVDAQRKKEVNQKDFKPTIECRLEEGPGEIPRDHLRPRGTRCSSFMGTGDVTMVVQGVTDGQLNGRIRKRERERKTIESIARLRFKCRTKCPDSVEENKTDFGLRHLGD